MASLMFLQTSFVVMIMMGCLMGPSEAFTYYVGGKEGWSLKPSKTFNHWASLNRFQVNDSLIFKYENGTDSVLQVDQDDYNTCNKTNPISALENKGEYSTFNLDHSGFFFFISGHADNCKKGEKIIILVMAPRNYTKHTSPTPAPSPFQEVLPPTLSIVQGIAPVSSQAPSPVGVSTPIGSQAPFPFQGISHVLPPAPSPIPEVTHILPPAQSPVQEITPISSQAPSPFHKVTHDLPPAPSPFHRVTHDLPPAPSPFHRQRVTHGLPPAPSPIRQVTHVLPPAQSPSQRITPISSPAPSRVGKSTHHIHSPAPSPIRGVSHVRPPAPSPVQRSTSVSSPAPSPTPVISPAAPVPSEAASPGPSDQAPSPDNGKSAAAPKSFGGYLLIVMLLFWMVFI